MNYKLYNLEQNIKKVGKKLADIVFYLPRRLYKKNTSFKSFITKRENNSYDRNRKRILAKDIFYYLNKNGKCEILCGYVFEDDFYFDVFSRNVELLLENGKWAKKNKLQIVETTLFEHMKENNPDYLFKVSDWQKEDKIYIITRKKDLK